MDSKILFLGTAGETQVWSAGLRKSGGIVVQLKGAQFLIDPGLGCIGNANTYHIDLKATTAVLVSHAHINHCNDVNAVLSTMASADKRGVLIANETLLKGDKDHSPYVTTYHQSLIKESIVAVPGKRITVGKTEIQPLPAYHHDQHSVGFKLFTPHFVLTYSSDTKYRKDLGEHYAQSDILVLNVKYPFSSRKKDALTSADAVKLINKAKPKLCIITHFGKAMLDANPLYEAREIQKQTDVQVIAAEDGLEINPPSYAAQMKQKRLHLYPSV